MHHLLQAWSEHSWHGEWCGRPRQQSIYFKGGKNNFLLSAILKMLRKIQEIQ
jgi:hypothetical protein